MYIRASTQQNKKNKRSYTTYRLVTTYRNQDNKVRQRTLLNLGSHFSVAKENWKSLADRIEEIIRGQQSLLPLPLELEKEAQKLAKQVLHKEAQIDKVQTQQKIAQASSTPSIDYQEVDVESLQHQHCRYIGAEHVAYHAATQLNLAALLKALGFNSKQTHIALGAIIGRLIHPGSELSTHRYLKEHSALDELIGCDFSQLSLKQFYQIADKLLKHKSEIEQALYQREQTLFNLEQTLTLFDITNTYFEGSGLQNEKAAYGRSKEKRSDCLLVALGLVLDGSGFPKRSEIFPGNVSEPSTLAQMIDSLKGDKKTTIILDAGIASQANLDWLNEQGYYYIVVSRKAHQDMPQDSATVTVKETKHNRVQVALVRKEDSEEIELYCHSKAKQVKTEQMQSKASIRYEEQLNKLATGLEKKGTIKSYEKIIERLGRLKEKYKKVAKHYTVTVTPDEQNKNATTLTWTKQAPTDTSNGVYCLRTNRQDLDEKTLWRTYTTLTDIEAAFRSLKSELGLRPVYHQKEQRIDAHLFITIIAYHLLHTIRYQLKEKGIHHSWQTLRELLATQMRLTTTLNLKDGRAVSIRKTVAPDSNQATIFKALEISSLPGRTEKSYL